MIRILIFIFALLGVVTAAIAQQPSSGSVQIGQPSTLPAWKPLIGSCTLAPTGAITCPFAGIAPTATSPGDMILWNGSQWGILSGNYLGTAFLSQTAGVPAWLPAAGTGTVLSVTCGDGLTGGTITTSGTCALDKPVTPVAIAVTAVTSGSDVLLGTTNTGCSGDTPCLANVGIGAGLQLNNNTLNSTAYNPSFLINGDFLYDQPKEGAAYNVANTQVPVMDGFDAHVIPSSGTPAATQVTVQRATNSPVPSPYSKYNAVVTTVSSIGASDHYTFEQKIEGDRIAPFGFGTTSARPITLQWGQFCSLGGTYSLAIVRTSDTGRSYVHSYSLIANQWNYYQITIPGDTTSGWVNSGSSASMEVDFVLGAASHFQTTTLDAWQNGEYLAAAGQIDLGPNTGAYCVFAIVKGEVGAAATPFVPRLPAVELAVLRRYYDKSYPPGTIGGAAIVGSADIRLGTADAIYGTGGTVKFHHTMICSPTVHLWAPASGTSNKARDFANSADVTVNIGGGTTDNNGFFWSANPSTGTTGYLGVNWTADCRLS